MKINLLTKITEDEAHVAIRSIVNNMKGRGTVFDKKALRFNEMAQFLATHGQEYLFELVRSCVPGEPEYIKGKPIYLDRCYDPDWLT